MRENIVDPEYVYPSYYLGVDESINTFMRMCDYFRDTIKKDYKKIVVFGDSRHAAVALSVSYYLRILLLIVLSYMDKIHIHSMIALGI